MTRVATFSLCIGLSVAAIVAHGASAASPAPPASSPSWNARAAAAYLDGRMDWWVHWPNAARDHDTVCVSCHTAVPYAMARPALRSATGEHDLASPERAMLASVVKRVRMWKEVEPFYPDQTRGLPKSSESRGTEAILNAVVLSARDASAGTLTDDTRQAFNNLWALQFKAGDLKGAWAWLNFRYEPWEATDSVYYGAAIAALAVATAPGAYASTPDIQDQLTLLRDYLQRGLDKQQLFNRLTALWASTSLSMLLRPDQRQAIIDAALARQQDDGGWSLSTLGTWKRADGTALDGASDGYATGFVALVLQRAGVPRTDVHVGKALTWLARHQDAATGMWSATSLNKDRDPASDAGKFMSDAATAYAALALVEPR
jgi:squalene-hopene/tetraprenyl-beta-curcumene cyclase